MDSRWEEQNKGMRRSVVYMSSQAQELATDARMGTGRKERSSSVQRTDVPINGKARHLAKDGQKASSYDV